MNDPASHELLAPTFLFHFAATCPQRKAIWPLKTGTLPDACRIPSFRELEGRTVFADLRAAWNSTGMVFTVAVQGKKQPVWCRDSRIEDSDGLHLWIDTRATHNVHRASRHCHRFAFLPAGAGSGHQQPVARMLPIHRAREAPKPVAEGLLQVHSRVVRDGYTLQAFLPKTALTGFEPADHPRLGFFYAVVDRELGWQTLSLGPEFPIQEDPSLWGTLELST